MLGRWKDGDIPAGNVHPLITGNKHDAPTRPRSTVVSTSHAAALSDTLGSPPNPYPRLILSVLMSRFYIDSVPLVVAMRGRDESCGWSYFVHSSDIGEGCRNEQTQESLFGWRV